MTKVCDFHFKYMVKLSVKWSVSISNYEQHLQIFSILLFMSIRWIR